MKGFLLQATTSEDPSHGSGQLLKKMIMHIVLFVDCL